MFSSATALIFCWSCGICHECAQCTLLWKGENMMYAVQKSADTFCNLHLTSSWQRSWSRLSSQSEQALSWFAFNAWRPQSELGQVGLHPVVIFAAALNFVNGVVNDSSEGHHVRLVSASTLGEFSSSHSHTWTAARSPACSTHFLQLEVVNVLLARGLQRNLHCCIRHTASKAKQSVIRIRAFLSRVKE